MDNEFTYDPEDLERLLKEKSFSELLPEEKAFVLQFVENDLEYDSMRETLESLIAVPSMEEAISPKAATKEALMAAFSAKTVENQKEEREEKTGFWAWLWNTNKTILYRPGFQLASLALVLVSVFYIATFSPIDRTAQVIKKEPSPKESTANESKKEERKITLESVTEEEEEEEEEEVKAIDVITEPITLVSEKDIEESTLDLNEAPELDQLEGILLDDSKFEIEDKKIEREADEIEQIEENNTKFNYQETESYTEIIITDVILENINADKTTLIYDARETTGNMASTPLNKTEVSSTMFSKSRNSLAASDVSLSDISINIPIKASKYSSLLSKLYTAQ
ncbi:MAG: hypothetical protein QMB45_04150 [Flavobacteriales bacterium]|jgi:hypothetical protein